jgi:hypothetical protein
VSVKLYRHILDPANRLRYWDCQVFYSPNEIEFYKDLVIRRQRDPRLIWSITPSAEYQRRLQVQTKPGEMTGYGWRIEPPGIGI